MKNTFVEQNNLSHCLSKLVKFRDKINDNNTYASIFLFLLLIFVFFVVFFFNLKTPMIGDDYVYSFLYQTPQRLSSLMDIVDSQCLHYRVWGGRSVVHTITQVLLFIKIPLLTDVINSLIFVVFIYAVYYFITAGKRKSLSLLFVVFALTWLLQPAFAEAVLWITGSANYLWGTLIVVLFLLPYRLYSNKKKRGISIQYLLAVLMFFAGVIAGWTNENTAAAMIVMVTLFVFYYKKINYTIPLWMYLGLIGSLIGYVLMIAAPGNFERAGGVDINPFLVLYRTLTYTHNFINYLGVLNLGGIVLLILYLKFGDEKNKKIVPYLALLLIGLLVSIYIMVASPGFPPRAWFGSITFNIIIFGIIFVNLDYTQAFFCKIKYAIVAFCVFAFSFSFYDAYNDVTTINKIWQERLSLIEQEKKAGTGKVLFKMYYPKTKFGLGDTPYAISYISSYYQIDFQLEP